MEERFTIAGIGDRGAKRLNEAEEQVESNEPQRDFSPAHNTHFSKLRLP